MIPNRNRLIALLVVVAAAIVAGIGVARYVLKDKTPASGGTGGTSDTTGRGQEVVKNCLDVKPEPVRYKFDDSKFPTGKLGEWYEVKNKQGQTILRVKVDLEDAIAAPGVPTDEDPLKLKTIGVKALFRLTLENVTCHPFEWDVTGSQGIWFGWRPRKERSGAGELDGWLWGRPKAGPPVGIWITRNGKILYADDVGFGPELQAKMDAKLMDRYKLPVPAEFPDKAFPPGVSTGQFYILLPDILGRDRFQASTGPKGDGHIPLVLGGYMGFARIDLGTGKDWFREYLGDPEDPKWMDMRQVDIGNLERKTLRK